MKKLFAVLAIASFMTACNDATDTKVEDGMNNAAEQVKESGEAAIDKVDSTAEAAKDTINAQVKEVVDSLDQK